MTQKIINNVMIDTKYSAVENILKMLEQEDLYEKCISTPNFAYHFSQICNKAFLFEKQNETNKPKEKI